MRISGVLILVVLLSMAVVVFLQSRDVSSTQEALAVISTELQEEGVEGVPFDRARAREIIAVLEMMIADPGSISRRTGELKTIAETAAGWAAGAASPSAELHISVAIRKAAGELRSYAVRPKATALTRARHQLDLARQTLDSTGGGSGTEIPSGMITDGMKDRLHNIEASQKERMLEVEEELGN
jgi:hypothetical protein